MLRINIKWLKLKELNILSIIEILFDWKSLIHFTNQFEKSSLGIFSIVKKSIKFFAFLYHEN